MEIQSAALWLLLLHAFHMISTCSEEAQSKTKIIFLICWLVFFMISISWLVYALLCIHTRNARQHLNLINCHRALCSKRRESCRWWWWWSNKGLTSKVYLKYRSPGWLKLFVCFYELQKLLAWNNNTNNCFVRSLNYFLRCCGLISTLSLWLFNIVLTFVINQPVTAQKVNESPVGWLVHGSPTLMLVFINILQI